MITKSYTIVGVMSGTSLDGIDIIYTTISYTGNWAYNIHHATTVPYSEKWLSILKALTTTSLEDLKQLDHEYTEYLAITIQQFITKHKIIDLDFVASHGHTALHQPQQKLTYQIGNLPLLADILGVKVICDFRVQDVELGGQGAPLVPIGDALLFHDYTYCLNLGGFANVSYEDNQERIAFDICPVNIVLNHYTATIGMAYDNGGQLAAQGQVHKDLLNALNGLEFYKAVPPKSLGLEWVQQQVLPVIDAYNLSVETILCTVVEHVAIQIAVYLNKENTNVLITGGGAYNTYVIERVNYYAKAKIEIPDAQLIEYKEALIFALLGVLKERNEVNCLASVTGAIRNHSSGRVFD